METRIGTQLTALLEDLVPLNLAEAETNSYPYAVYELSPEPIHTKDGVIGFRSEVPVRIYAKDFDTARGLADSVEEAIEEGMSRRDMYAVLRQTFNDCTDGIWELELQYVITDYPPAEEPEPTPTPTPTPTPSDDDDEDSEQTEE